MAAKIKDKAPEEEVFLALTGESGPLAAGALPSIGNVSAEGEKAIYQSLCGEVAKPKTAPKPKKTEGEATEVKPATPQEQAQASLQEVFKQATEARKHALQLKQFSYSGELVEQLMGFSTAMETIFEKVTELQNKNVVEDKPYIEQNQLIAAKLAWYKSAEAQGFLVLFWGILFALVFNQAIRSQGVSLENHRPYFQPAPHKLSHIFSISKPTTLQLPFRPLERNQNSIYYLSIWRQHSDRRLQKACRVASNQRRARSPRKRRTAKVDLRKPLPMARSDISERSLSRVSRGVVVSLPGVCRSISKKHSVW